MALDGHGLDVEPGALGVEARQVAQGVLRARDLLRRRARPHRRFDPVVVHRPRGVVDRQCAQGTGLGLGVLEDRAPSGFDQQQLAGPEAATPDGLGSAERDCAGF